MILDRIENAAMYRTLGPDIAQALDYLTATDFEKVADGRHELDGDRLFALVSHLNLKGASEAVWESHQHYIDVQYVIRGTERMGYACLRNDSSVAQPYNAENDAAFYNVAGDFFTVREGGFAIFAPQDLHAPGLLPEPATGLEVVHKVVVKVRIA